MYEVGLEGKGILMLIPTNLMAAGPGQGISPYRIDGLNETAEGQIPRKGKEEGKIDNKTFLFLFL
ncbi:MAG: hypothetical protein QXE05_12050 [Nitrososphaeria archaeon]